MYKTIEILLADDHEIFRDGFNLMLKKNTEIKLTGEAPNGKELLKMAHKLKPDVIITDIQMPVMDGVTVIRLLGKELPQIGIIALSMYNEENEIIEALEAGAKGYLVKNAHKTEIIEAIKAVYKDQNYYCKQTTQKLAKRIADSNFKNGRFIDKTEFSETEKEIMRLICDEYSNKEIGDCLGLSKRTVEWHRHGISEKLHTKNTAGIVVYAIRNKIYETKKKSK